MQCKKCGTEVTEMTVFCPVCGEPVSNNNVASGSVEDNNNPFEDANENNVESNELNEQPVNNLEETTTENDYSIENKVEEEVPTVQEETPVQKEEPMANQPTAEVVQPVFNSSSVTSSYKAPKKKISKKLLIIICSIVGVLLVAGIVLFIIFKNGGKSVLKCTSDNNSIVIKYNKNKILSYTASGDLEFNIKEQNEVVESEGIDGFVEQYNSRFTSAYSGVCTVDGKELERNTVSSKKTVDEKFKIVGDDTRGYIYVPADWAKFVDTAGVTALQYSYANAFIVSLDIVQAEAGTTAKDAANAFLKKAENDDTVSKVEGAKVTIGSDKEYEAYQVYMYYASDKTYLVTYWFDDENGKIHYISLEGPAYVESYEYSISDLTVIPESFKLKNN